ncbi:YpsA SLOG family protein [Thermodesulfobacteriota bacterium]
MIKKIISGGQTGADRAALDVVLKFDIPHGGWIPKGRIAEDGTLFEIYKLQKMPTESYPARTEQNVIESDGTLIIARGKLTGGTDLTRQMTLKHKKQLLGIDLNLVGHFDAASLIVSWIKLQRVQVLNVAGPRKSEDPQIYADVITILEQVIKILADEDRKSKIELEHHEKGKPSTPPKTVEEAVDRLINELSLKDRTTISHMDEGELINLHHSLGEYIRNEFGLWSGNDDLMSSCCAIAKMDKVHEDTASTIIIEKLWERLRDTHKLRIVK